MAETLSATAPRLRQELKLWEKAFTAAHAGRKATRADIKNDATIAAKYKLYDQLCRSERNTCATPDRKKTALPLQTNHPAITINLTPRKGRNELLSPARPVTVLTMPTPDAVRQKLGRTPLKDGQILGLFDDLPETDSISSPSANTSGRGMPLSTDASHNVMSTPSKARRSSIHDSGLSRTPTSSSKRFMLDTFATPTQKRKQQDHQGTPSTSKRVCSTPQFLRRSRALDGTGLDAVQEEADVVPAQPVFKKRNLVRSLSTIIRGLKKQEVDKADEDWDVLQELEGNTTALPSRARAEDTVPEIQYEMPPPEEGDMPLGPDTLAVSDDEDSPDEAAGGQPRRIWKKKGLKRQTKKHNMRPIYKALTNDETPDINAMMAQARKTQDAANDSDGSAYSDSEDKENRAHGPNAAEAGKEKKKRKVNEAAHANFCRLKIKNKNSKAKGRGRFGRR